MVRDVVTTEKSLHIWLTATEALVRHCGKQMMFYMQIETSTEPRPELATFNITGWLNHRPDKGLWTFFEVPNLVHVKMIETRDVHECRNSNERHHEEGRIEKVLTQDEASGHEELLPSLALGDCNLDALN